jgi:hypothetical protein
MTIVFWKRQYQLQMASTSSIVYPVAWYVNSCTVERKNSQITKRNSSLTLDF